MCSLGYPQAENFALCALLIHSTGYVPGSELAYTAWLACVLDFQITGLMLKLKLKISYAKSKSIISPPLSLLTTCRVQIRVTMGVHVDRDAPVLKPIGVLRPTQANCMRECLMPITESAYDTMYSYSLIHI